MRTTSRSISGVVVVERTMHHKLKFGPGGVQRFPFDQLYATPAICIGICCTTPLLCNILHIFGKMFVLCNVLLDTGHALFCSNVLLKIRFYFWAFGSLSQWECRDFILYSELRTQDAQARKLIGQDIGNGCSFIVYTWWPMYNTAILVTFIGSPGINTLLKHMLCVYIWRLFLKHVAEHVSQNMLHNIFLCVRHTAVKHWSGSPGFSCHAPVPVDTATGLALSGAH